MSIEPEPQDTLRDQIVISRLEQDWGLWRDTGRWERLRAAYAPSATMVTTWFDGSAEDFVDASMRSFGGPALALHFIGPCTVEVAGGRAVAETRVALHLRAALDGMGVDVVCHGRFVDRLVKAGADWRIASRMPVYEKDTLAPVVPGQVLALDAAKLDSLPAGYRHIAYLQSLGGATIVTRIPAHNSEEQRRLYAETSAWLHAG